MYTEADIKPYYEELKKIRLDESLVEYIQKHINDEKFNALVEYGCNVLLDVIQRSYYIYDNNVLKESVEIKTYIEITKFVKDEALSYYLAVAEFFKGNKNKVFSYLKTANEYGFFYSDDVPFKMAEFANCFIAPFKGAFPKFWDDVYELLLTMKVEKGVLELCKAVPIFYSSKDSDEIREALERVIAIDPDSVVAKELLAINYYKNKMWGNAVALFEQIEENLSTLFNEDYYFMMAWCYGKLKETNHEIEAYKKSVEILPEGFSTMNNLGYAYYKAKQYNHAIECFQKCMENNWEVKYAANNYVRTLLAMQRFKDAKAFVKTSPVKISKDLTEKVKRANDTNKRITKDISIEAIESENLAVAEKNIPIGVKKQQFTSEKILEDEVVLRIESGLEVFGKKLKIYRRKGIYGRQYVLSNGKRPDLIAEDSEGNLYVIELKKDSGYDDAYEQIVNYLDWFDSNWSDNVKNIYGIICLNNPTDDLLKKVHNNDRIRVFEYQISYTER